MEFNNLTATLRAMGYEVVNPVELDDSTNPEGCWFKYLKRDLQYLLTCDSVCLLKGWEESKGARLEVLVALQLELPLFRLDENRNLIEAPVAIDTEITPLLPSYIWE